MISHNQNNHPFFINKKVYFYDFLGLLVICLLMSCAQPIKNQPTKTIYYEETPPTKTPEVTNVLTYTVTETTALTIFRDLRHFMKPGDYVVYWQDNYFYVQSLDDEPPIFLMSYHSPSDVADLSPDGNRVAFVTWDNQVGIYDLAKGQLTTYPNPGVFYFLDFEWSPDGKTLLYTGLLNEFNMPEFNQYEIYAISLDKELTTKLIGPDDNFQDGGLAPWFSPDGNWVLFTGLVTSPVYFREANIYIFNSSCILDSVTCGTSSKYLFGYKNVSWSPDGKFNYACTIGNQYGPCLIDMDSTDSPQILFDTRTLTGINDIEIFNLDWSPNGKNMAFSAFYNKTDLGQYRDAFIYSFEKSELINITNTPDIQSEGTLRWSLDGKYLAYYQILPSTEVITKPPIGYDSFSFFYNLHFYSMEKSKTIDFWIASSESKAFSFWMKIE